MAGKKFRLQRKQQPIEFEGPDGGTLTYTMVELSGAERDKWLSNMAAKLKVNSEGQPTGMRDVMGIQADLLSICLRDESGKIIDMVIIQQWPASVQTELFDMAQTFSGLKPLEAVKEAKND